eukprot:scaffold6064_cov173-Amphora_coffeaeformis.AAC.7
MPSFSFSIARTVRYGMLTATTALVANNTHPDRQNYKTILSPSQGVDSFVENNNYNGKRPLRMGNNRFGRRTDEKCRYKDYPDGRTDEKYRYKGFPDGQTDEKYRYKGCSTKCTIPTDDIQTKNTAKGFPDGRTDEKYRYKDCGTKCTIPTDDIQTKNTAIRAFRMDGQTKNTAIKAFRMDGQTKNTAIKAVAQSVRMVAVRLSALLFAVHSSRHQCQQVKRFFVRVVWNNKTNQEKQEQAKRKNKNGTAKQSTRSQQQQRLQRLQQQQREQKQHPTLETRSTYYRTILPRNFRLTVPY